MIVICSAVLMPISKISPAEYSLMASNSRPKILVSKLLLVSESGLSSGRILSDGLQLTYNRMHKLSFMLGVDLS